MTTTKVSSLSIQGRSLNPCYNGNGHDTINSLFPWNRTACLNPCYNGNGHDVDKMIVADHDLAS